MKLLLHFILLLSLLYFNCLVHSSSPFIQSEGDTVQEQQKAKKEINSSKLISTVGGNSIEILRKALENYDKWVRPNFRGGPVIVKVNMTILSVPIFREKDFRWIIMTEIAREWQDERLNLNTSNVFRLSPKQAVSEIWQPDIGFDATESRVHGAFDYEESFHIYANGTISHVFQVTLSTHCGFLLHDYPFDRRTCEISIGSTSYGVNEVLYMWADDVENPVQFRKVALKPLNEWQFDYFRLSDSIKTSARGTQLSRINLEVIADRKPFQLIVFFFIPMTLLVICSWIPTFIPDNLAARVISGVGILGTTVVMLLNRPLGSEYALPYYTYADLYSLASLLEVMAYLWESAAVIYLKKREKATATNRIRSDKWNHIFNVCTPIVTIIIVGGFVISIILMYQARMPDHSLRATVDAICNDTGESLRRPLLK